MNAEHIESSYQLRYGHEYSILKMNAVFEAEFVLRNEISVKSFSTWKHELYRSFDLCKCYLRDITRGVPRTRQQLGSLKDIAPVDKLQQASTSSCRLQPFLTLDSTISKISYQYQMWRWRMFLLVYRCGSLSS